MILTWSTGEPDRNMSEEILTDLAALIAAHPWFQDRARLAIALLRHMNVHPPARVLDAGCGWGLTLQALERAGYRATGLDVSRRALELLDKPGRQLIEADLTQPLPPVPDTFDAVLALDVIEHLDDDSAAVARLAQLVKPGGALIVSVPSLPDLYSEFDAVQGHRRRYLPDTLHSAFAGSGAIVERLLWWGGWLVPVLRRQRNQRRGRAGDAPAEIYRRYLTLPSWPVPSLLRLAFSLDRFWTLRGHWRRGTSLLALARRPKV